jgi:hypothetical protein
VDPPGRLERDGLTRGLYDRSLVRSSLLRGTQHMVTAADYLASDQHRSRVCVGAVVQPTVLVDGVVVAMWKLVRERGGAVLEIELLTRLSGTDQTTVAQEGMRLLDFAAADADDHDIRLVAPGS